MKAIFPVVWLLVCLLSTFNASVVAASTQDQSSSGHSAVKQSQPAAAKKTPPVKAPATAKHPKSVKKHAAVVSKSRQLSDVVTTRLPPAKLDLSLPPEMVKQLQPIGTVPMPKRAPLLPPMFGEKPKEDSPFQLNGRLLNNEMQLQLRNEERREVEGAALDFQFKQ